MHRGRVIYQNPTPEVGFFFVLFREKLIGASIYLPVNVFCTLSIVVKLVFGKFN